MYALIASLLLAQTNAKIFTQPVYLTASGPPNLVMAVDTVGADRGGLLILDPRDRGNLDFEAFSELGKLCQPSQARNGFLAHTVAAAVGDFIPGERNCVAVLSSDGSVRIEHGFEADKGSFAKDDLAATLAPTALAGKGVWRALPFHLGGKDSAVKGVNPREVTDSLLICSPTGRLICLANDGAGRFAPHAVDGRLHASRIQSGNLGGNGVSALVWMDGSGQVYRAGISPAYKLVDQTRLIRVEPGAGLAVGHFLDSSHTDVLAGQELLLDGDPSRVRTLTEVASSEVAKNDLEWLAADLAGDGKDDLIRVRRSQEAFTSDDIYAQYEPGAAGFCDSSNDGLPDAWKTGAIRPGGLDLAAMGCRPEHKDVIVEVQPMWNVSPDHIKAEMKKVVDYFASLKVSNLDGTRGVAMHVIYRDPMDKSDDGQSWPALGDKYHPKAHRGITHWMEVYHGGGGQSDIMFDRGSCGDNAMAPVFIHEFGHQLGLDHNGRWIPDGCPIYPSLMNYPYNYQLNGKRENVGYSDGKLIGVTLNETHLNKYLPVSPSMISFIAGPPYRFKIQPAPDGKGTLVDWNWDGDFKEKWVKADINYGYGTTAGLRSTIGKTYTVPAPVVAGGGRDPKLMIFFGQLLSGAPAPVADGSEKEPSLSPKRPGRLQVRQWLGKDASRSGDHWSVSQDVETAGVTGDPSCAVLNGVAWLAYPTTDGVKVRSVDVQDGKATFADVTVLPNTADCQVTLATLGGQLALLLWHGPNAPVTLQLLKPEGSGSSFSNAPQACSPLATRKSSKIPVPIGAPISLAFTSKGPVGAAEGPKSGKDPTLWIGLTQDQDPKKTYRWQLRRFAWNADKPIQLSQEWIGGDKGGERVRGRVSVLWEPDPALGPDGQVYLFATGAYGDDSPWACSYITMRIGEKSVNGGWLTRRYYDEWTQSRSGPGVCFFRGDIFYASRWVAAHDSSNDNMFVAFYGRGIRSEPMGDFDDISYIRDYGFHRSIATLSR